MTSGFDAKGTSALIHPTPVACSLPMMWNPNFRPGVRRRAGTDYRMNAIIKEECRMCKDKDRPVFTPAELDLRRSITRSFEASTIQEGYTPSAADRELVRRLTEGEITEPEYRALVMAALKDQKA